MLMALACLLVLGLWEVDVYKHHLFQTRYEHDWHWQNVTWQFWLTFYIHSRLFSCHYSVYLFQGLMSSRKYKIKYVLLSTQSNTCRCKSMYGEILEKSEAFLCKTLTLCIVTIRSDILFKEKKHIFATWIIYLTFLLARYLICRQISHEIAENIWTKNVEHSKPQIF